MIGKLIKAIRKTNAPIVVGLDPKLSFIPDRIRLGAYEQYGENNEGAAEALWIFNKEIIDGIYDLIPAVKPQAAMYEQFGVAGMQAFQKTIDYCHKKGLIVIGDIKRGDIGSTSTAYAVGHLGTNTIGNMKCTGFNEDFATVNPYLGSDGVKPFIDICNKEDKGIFVLVKTSNPSSGEFQDMQVLVSGKAGDAAAEYKPLYELVGEYVSRWGEDSLEDGYSNVGAVVGATYPEMGRALRQLMPHTYILVPGYGAQGGKGSDLVDFFNKDGLGAIVNSSRGIIAAWQKDEYKSFGANRIGEASRAAVQDMIEDITKYL